MSDRKLSDREELILQAVVHSYITTAEPVGSRALVKRFGLDISPATVRNVMADLEEAGFIQQLHASSGRVPTDAGYRYYVDYLMRVQELTASERMRIDAEFKERLNDADVVLRQTSHLLALISHQTSIVEAPNDGDAEISHIEVLPIAGHRVVVLLADNCGRVRTSVVAVPETLSNTEVGRLNLFLNDNLRGVPADRLSSSIRARLTRFADEQRQLAEHAIRVLDLLPAGDSDPLFLEGATQIFEQPEFRDVDKAREVFGLLEERDKVMELLRAGVATNDPHDLRILIGREAPQHGMDEISVVSAPYSVGGKTVGMLGILGPRRMPYSRLTGIVDYTAGVLGRLLTRLST